MNKWSIAIKARISIPVNPFFVIVKLPLFRAIKKDKTQTAIACRKKITTSGETKDKRCLVAINESPQNTVAASGLHITLISDLKVLFIYKKIKTNITYSVYLLKVKI